MRRAFRGGIGAWGVLSEFLLGLRMRLVCRNGVGLRPFAAGDAKLDDRLGVATVLDECFAYRRDNEIHGYGI